MLPGMIMLWAGAIVDIPSGWHLCDGTVGTPDLRNKFVEGAGGVDDPGDTGGTSAHTHAFTGDGHSHDLTSGTQIEDVTPLGSMYHVTSVSPATGTTGYAATLPPYMALCYIMKL